MKMKQSLIKYTKFMKNITSHLCFFINTVLQAWTYKNYISTQKKICWVFEPHTSLLPFTTFTPPYFYYYLILPFIIWQKWSFV